MTPPPLFTTMPAAEDDPPRQPSAAQDAGPSLKQRFVSGSVWTVAGVGAGQLLRLASNLVLTRLLTREAFAVMALAQIALQGADMFTNFGIRGSIVQHPRGEEDRFYNTGWTAQVLRGFGLWGLVAGGGYLAAMVYDQPMLVPLLAVGGASLAIAGFESTALYTLARRVTPAKTIGLDLASSLAAFVVTVVWALLSPTVWALVGGTIARALVKTVLSHLLIRDHRNRLVFDRQAALAIYRYGRWVLFSTLLAFILRQGDRLVLGKVMSTAQFGVYAAVAVMIAGTVEQVMKRLSRTMLMPVYAQLFRRDPERLRHNTWRIRGGLLALFLPGTCVLAVAGPYIVRLLWDPRWWDAGWMLQILAIGLVGRIVTISADIVLLSVGDSLRHMILQWGRAALLVGGMIVGEQVGGTVGLLIGMAAANFLEYPLLAVMVRRYDVWLPKLDALCLGSCGLVIGVGLWLQGGIHWG